MTKRKKAKSQKPKTFDWWLALDPCTEPTIRKKRKPNEAVASEPLMKAPSTLQAEKVARDMDLLGKRIRKAQVRNAFTNEQMLAWYVNAIGLFRTDHLWDETLPSYSELLENYISSNPVEGVLSSAAKPKRAGAPPGGPQARKRAGRAL
jgi:hypothetical protein